MLRLLRYIGYMSSMNEGYIGEQAEEFLLRGASLSPLTKPKQHFDLTSAWVQDCRRHEDELLGRQEIRLN